MPIKFVTWPQVREEIYSVNKKLFHIIEQIDPDPSYKLIKIKYPYGEKICDLGTLQTPTALGRYFRLDHPETSEAFRKVLTYAPTPLVLQLKNESEIFIDMGSRIVPLNVFKPGDLYGHIDSLSNTKHCPIAPVWNITSGVRSVFMLPKITSNQGHHRLRVECGVDPSPPKYLKDHWYTFKKIVQNSTAHQWSTQIIVFTDQWLREKHDVNWLKLHNFLLKETWKTAQLMQLRDEMSVLWETFAQVFSDKALVINPYIVGTIKHLIYLAGGAIPGFRPSNQETHALPGRTIEKAYEEIYGMKDYFPTIMMPSKLNVSNQYCPIYYSMNYPTLQECSPLIKRTANVITDLRDVKNLLSTLEYVLENEKKLYNTLTYKLMKSSLFEFFHREKDRFGDISDSKEQLANDPNLNPTHIHYNKQKTFSMTSPFLRSCIRIRKKAT